MQNFNHWPSFFNSELDLPYVVYAAGEVFADPGFSEFHDGHNRHYCGMFWCRSGHSEFGIGSTRFVLRRHEAVFYLPEEGHSIKNSSPDFSYYWIVFGGPEAVRIVKSFHFPQRQPFHAGPPPEELYGKLFHSMDDLSIQARYADTGLVMQLLLAMARQCVGRQESAAATTTLLDQVKDAIMSQYANPALSLQSLSEELHVHRTTITRQMNRTWGMLPSEYLVHFRLRQAMQMLLSPEYLTVSQVAYACGFTTPGYFCRCFKRKTGMTPARYRKNKRFFKAAGSDFQCHHP